MAASARKWAECWFNSFGVRLMAFRSQTALARGAVPGPEESWAKIIITGQGQRSAICGDGHARALGSLTAEELGDSWNPVEEGWYWAPAFRIAGGTDEILRNILAERVLGLPPDIRVDRDIPFNKINSTKSTHSGGRTRSTRGRGLEKFYEFRLFRPSKSNFATRFAVSFQKADGVGQARSVLDHKSTKLLGPDSGTDWPTWACRRSPSRKNTPDLA